LNGSIGFVGRAGWSGWDSRFVGFDRLALVGKIFFHRISGRLFSPAMTQAALNCAPMSLVCVRGSEKKVATFSAPTFL